LPEESTRQYKRGHRQRAESLATGDITDQADEPYTAVDEDTGEPFTIDDAAKATPDDPEPKDRAEDKPKTQLKVTAALKRDVEGKLAFAMALGGQVWVMADPVCGSAFIDQTPEIAKKLTPIVCQSPDIVKWLTKSSSYILWVDLFMACWPVLQIIFAHHIARTIQRESANGYNATMPNDFVVQ
jgi:hypothetical protein